MSIRGFKRIVAYRNAALACGCALHATALRDRHEQTSPSLDNLSVAMVLHLGIFTLMNRLVRRHSRATGWRLFCLAMFLALAPFLHAADSFLWQKEKDSVSADIGSWTLMETLEHIAEATGWQIYLEPGTQRKVSTKFKDRPKDQALDFLLGDLGRALLPGTNGVPSRLLVFRTTQKQATQLVAKAKEDPTKKPIANELVVTLKPGESIDELAKKLGAKVTGRNDAERTYRLEFESSEAAQKARSELAQHPGVESVDNNFYVRRPEGSEGLGILNPANLDLEPKAPSCSSVPKSGLIDTAVQKTGAAFDDLILPTISLAGEPGPASNLPSHATGMSQAMLQALSKKQTKTEWRVQPYDVYGNNPNTTTFDVANGVAQAIKDGANPINLSLGSAGDSEFLHKMIQNGAKQGVLFVAAAGNEPTTNPTYPGAYPEVVAVSSVGPDGKIAPYANRGDFVDVLAPGQVRVTYGGQTWITSGTSVSTAIVSGLAAGGVEGGCVTGAQLKTALQSLSTPAK